MNSTDYFWNACTMHSAPPWDGGIFYVPTPTPTMPRATQKEVKSLDQNTSIHTPTQYLQYGINRGSTAEVY